jgi:hypothetical protein
VRSGLATSNQAAQKIDMERFNLKKLSEEEVKQKYQVIITEKFAAMENLDDNLDINRAWGNIRENIKILAQENLGYCETRHCKSWFDEEYTILVRRRKEVNYSDCKTQEKLMKII